MLLGNLESVDGYAILVRGDINVAFIPSPSGIAVRTLRLREPAAVCVPRRVLLAPLGGSWG